ncbi:hypothetical protein LV476_04830 [Guyparkeria hydrothermalis]|uniref:hypothetical protein n=1 Tax=Guyparkeria hydrothermalis TaxID=923 RepID=UPI002021F3D4|nr:hypothetical protein [Guyparkeria hydrothermalis]MCL7744276.1 hypothetical protein [Guyparkeria hydrothermalis]
MTPTTNTMNWQQVSRILFETDPMHTACKENDCFDEYDRVARGVIAEIENGVTLDGALEQVLGDWFGQELIESRDLAPVVEQLNTQQVGGGSR